MPKLDIKKIKKIKERLSKYGEVKLSNISDLFEVSNGFKHGSHYTPQNLSQIIINKALKLNQKDKEFLICDPSMGTGNLLLQMAIDLEKTGIDFKYIIENMIYGFDINNDAIEIAKLRFINELKKRRYADLRDVNFNFFCSDFLLEKIDKKFDIIIGNPPYSFPQSMNKELSKKYQKKIKIFDKTGSTNFYEYFFVRGLDSLNMGGILTYIVPMDFFTIRSKMKLRKILQSKRIHDITLVHNTFDYANINPCIITIKNEEKNEYNFDFYDKSENYYFPKISLFKSAPNRVFFIPNEMNMKIYKKYIPKVNELLDFYWDKIKSNKDIAKNKKELDEYRENLKPGDITLLGLVTDGGEGLATANNGKYIGVKEGTKEAKRIKETRIKKINEFNKKYGTDYTIKDLTEFEIRNLFDSLKEKYGRDIFGKGYIYRIVSFDEIANVGELSNEEKQNGIEGSRTFVPYDKGDRDGNKWYYETPFYIDWSRENVEILKNDTKARFQGYAFYFKEGFSWSDIHTVDIKSRLKSNGVYDVKSMSLFTVCKSVSDKYLITMLNSRFISNYVFSFLNHTNTFQINDARQIPIIVPTDEQLHRFEAVFDRAKDIKIKEFSSQITKEEAKKELDKIQKEVDRMVYDLYFPEST